MVFAGTGSTEVKPFIDHIPDNTLAWLTLRNYGFSYATEVFVFVSGYTCVLAYCGALREQGWPTTVTQRGKLCTTLCGILPQCAGDRGLEDEGRLAGWSEFVDARCSICDVCNSNGKVIRRGLWLGTLLDL
jgi:hypothetical protein